MAVIHLVDAVKHSMLEMLKTAIDAGNEAGAIDFYTGIMPTLPTTAPTIPAAHVLLGTMRFSDPSCATVGTPTPGTMTFGTFVQDSSADASGVASWARISSVNSGVKTTVGDVDITTVGGGGTIQMNTTNVVALGPIIVASGSFSL